MVWYHLVVTHIFKSYFTGYKPFWNILGELIQYHGCWCPGSLRHQAISSHDIDHTGLTSPCLPCGRISMTCAVSVSGSDRKWKYISMFHGINSPRQWLNPGPMLVKQRKDQSKQTMLIVENCLIQPRQNKNKYINLLPIVDIITKIKPKVGVFYGARSLSSWTFATCFEAKCFRYIILSGSSYLL